MLRNAFRRIAQFFKSLWQRIHPPAEAGPASSGPFEDYLADKMNPETARKVVADFKKLQLPLPQDGDFLKGTEGALVFLNRYGVVLRIEKTRPEFTDHIVRLGHNPLVLRPIASIKALDAIIEICPGTHSDSRERDSAKIKDLLAKVGVDFWDDGAHNIGRLPFKTPQFPEGLPIVIDRLAVSKMSEHLAPVKKLLEIMKLEKDPQQHLYGKLSEAFHDAWHSTGGDTAKIAAFWNKCAASVKDGTLIAGWNEKRRDTYKISDARREAKHYERSFGAA
jgi:hypothetical protein